MKLALRLESSSSGSFLLGKDEIANPCNFSEDEEEKSQSEKK